ncbi:MAG: class I SAM-dependent methyltransferase [Proteobacteria bacterium]|nr:class I SAM-dependent methyltransferase [Pseudomonadota bacterium]
MPQKLQSYSKSHSHPEYGSKYEETYTRGYYFYQWEYIEKPLIKKIFNKLKLLKVESCLDIACGTGRILSVVEVHFPKTFGVDISESMLMHAKNKCKQSFLVRSDIMKTPFSNTFDLITAFRYFLNAEKELREKTLCNVYDLLSKDGFFVLNIHVNSRSIRGRYYTLRNKISGRNIANVIEYNDLVSDLNKYGFSVAETYWYSYLPRIGPYLSFIPRWFMPITERICRHTVLIPEFLAESFLIVCRKSD